MVPCVNISSCIFWTKIVNYETKIQAYFLKLNYKRRDMVLENNLQWYITNKIITKIDIFLLAYNS